MIDRRDDFQPENALGGLALAFLGDGVYELMVREYLLRKGGMPVGKLHARAVSYVRAPAQAKAYAAMEPVLSDEEKAIFLRGRNCSSTHVPKSASTMEYRASTGFEALFGWLYLEGRNERLTELFDIAISAVDEG